MNVLMPIMRYINLDATAINIVARHNDNTCLQSMYTERLARISFINSDVVNRASLTTEWFSGTQGEITLNVFSGVYNFFVLDGRTRRQGQSCRSTVQPRPP